jgi:cytosine/adenosine deaminase-related metal-dependent hydrolase
LAQTRDCRLRNTAPSARIPSSSEKPIHLTQSLSQHLYEHLTAVRDRRYSSQMIIRARIVVTMDGTPIENGAIAVSGNRIADVGRFDDIKKRNADNIVDLGEQALLPGLINAHCHLDYTGLRGKIPPQKSFTDWVRAINAEKSELSPNDYIASINDGFEETKRFGTTAIANLTAFPELISQIQPPIRTWWFAELIDIRAPERANELVDSAMDMLRASLECADMSALSKRGDVAALQLTQFGLAPHALFTASRDLFRGCEKIAQNNNVLLTTHLAESCEEMEMFRDASGPLYEFIKGIGRPMTDCGNETPLGQFLDLIGSGGSPNRPRAIEVNRPYLSWIVGHLNELTESDFDLLKRSNSKFHVVHCPRSHNYFGHSRFAFDRLCSFGFNICLGTDSLASNESLSLFAEMRAFQKEFPSVSPGEILQMATVNPARALRNENSLGQMRPGFKADLIAVPCSTSTDIFEQILAFDAPVSWLMVNGNTSASVPGSADR